MDELKKSMLLYLYKKDSKTLHEIETHFKKYESNSIRKVLDDMSLYDNTIDINQKTDILHSEIVLTDEGSVQATNLVILHELNTKEIWKQRAYGFFSGLLLSIITVMISVKFG